MEHVQISMDERSVSNKLSLSRVFSSRVWSAAELNLESPRVYKGSSRCLEYQSSFDSKCVCLLGSRKKSKDVLYGIERYCSAEPNIYIVVIM